MKKVFLFFVCAASFATANAQATFGVKAGANFATLSGSDASDVKMKVGFNIGGFADVPLASSISFRPELVFSTQGAKATNAGTDYKLNTSYINVPLLAKYTSTSGFFAETGPQVGFVVAAKAKAGGTDVDVKDSYKSTDFAWAFGLGYQMASGFGINGRYNLGLSSIDKGGAKVKNSVIQVGVFYAFGSSSAK